MGRARAGLSLTTMVSVLLTIGVLYTTPVFAAGNPSATGGGTTVEGGEKSTFTFNAIQHKNGTVSGHLVYHFRAADFSFHMDIDCLRIIGNHAVIGGTVTKVTGPAPPYIFEGAPAVFEVEDNGEGSAAPPDLISDVFFEVPTCQIFNAQPYLPIDGNIQVKP
jgi:hypothetical protein